MKDIISIAMGELTTAFDNEVVKAVQKVGIDVGKEELLKALELHRSLVRCVECRYKGMDICPMYKLTKAGVLKPYDFCSYGERNDNGF